MAEYDPYVMGKGAGDPKAIAKVIRENTEKAAQLMDPGDKFKAICSFTVEQVDEIADARQMRIHIARQMALVAGHLAAD
jgi:hypothetical protein